MKCWVTKKILPLYVSDDDIPIVHYFAKKHLENCSCCNDEYRKYQNARASIEALHELSPPEHLLGTDYWRQIKNQIVISQHDEPNTVFREKSSYFFKLSVAAALLVVVFAVTIYSKYDLQRLAPDPAQSAIHLAPSLRDTIKKTFEIRERPVKIYPLSSPESEYELNEASPIKVTKDDM